MKSALKLLMILLISSNVACVSQVKTFSEADLASLSSVKSLPSDELNLYSDNFDEFRDEYWEIKNWLYGKEIFEKNFKAAKIERVLSASMRELNFGN